MKLRSILMMGAVALGIVLSGIGQSPVAVTLSSVTSPASGEPGVTTINLTGSNFPSGTIPPANVTVSFKPPTGAVVTTKATAVTVIAGANERITFTIPASVSVANPTAYAVSITGSTSANTQFASSNTASLTVNPLASISSITPNTGQPGQSLSVTLAGKFSNWLQGSTVSAFGAGITATLKVTSTTAATAQLTIDPNAVPGPRTVTLTTGAEQATLVGGFTVTGLTQINPNSGQRGTTLSPNATITGTGTHFTQAASLLTFSSSGISATNITVVDSTHLTAGITIAAGASLGPSDITVTTGAETAIGKALFTVTDATAPAITSVNPNNGQQGTTEPVTIAGTATHFSASSRVTFGNSSVTAGTPSSASLGSLTVPVTVAANAVLGPTSVTVTTGSEVVTLNNAFTVAQSQSAASTITVATDQQVYRRAHPVQISGSVSGAGGTAISNIPVSIQIAGAGGTRVLNPYTTAQGSYSVTFQPAATDGGTFTVTATATSGGATRTATTTFRIFGLSINPTSAAQPLAMGSTIAIPLDLQNVGAALNNVTYSAAVTPAGALTTTFPQSVPTLAAGALITVPAALTAPNGNPPSTPVTVLITITSTDSISGATDPETATFAITLEPAGSTLTLTPPSINVGVNPGGTLTLKFAVGNQGFTASNNSAVTLQDPVTYNWVSLGNANLGNISPGATQIFQVTLNPPGALALGNYTVLFNVTGGASPLQGTINVSVTQSTLGAAQFTVSDDTGAKVNGATVTLVGTNNQKTFQGVTSANGQATIGGVNAGNYSYVVSAPFHDPGMGSVTVTANSTAQVSVILTYEVVNLTFGVTPTTITDQYNVSLQITYSTTLPKPALKVVPPQFSFSFFPEDVPNGQFPCSLTVTNTHPTANVWNIAVDASQLDAATPQGLAIHVLFPGGGNVFQIGALAGKQTTTVACYAVLDGDNVPTHVAGNIVISGNYYYTLDGQILVGTTTTKVPVTYTRPNELQYTSIPFTYDETGPAPVLTYNGGSFVYNLLSERAGKQVSLLAPSGAGFAAHNLFAFTQTQPGTTSLDVINNNLSGAFWHANFAKQNLANQGDSTTYDISTLDGGLDLFHAIQAQIAANPAQILNQPSYLGFEGQWSDRASPTGYLIPVQITTLLPDDSILLPLDWSKLTGGLECLNPQDPSCNLLDDLTALPPAALPNQDGQIVIQIDQKIRLERQAFNVSLGVGAHVTLTNTLAALKITDANGADASSQFFVLLTADPSNATKGGTINGAANIAWQLVPNVNAGGKSAGGVQYNVQATFTYTANGVTKTASTQAVAITVLPSPQLTVSYTAPFVVMNGKDAKLRVSITNVGFGTAKNFSIQSTQPKIVDTTNPNLVVNFNITGSSNTFDGSGFLPGNLTVNFGDVAPGATVQGYWVIRVSRNGFFIDTSSTFSQVDYQGVQLDPLVLTPTLTLIPALGGTVTSSLSPAIPNITVALTLNGKAAGSDVTDANGVYYIPDLTAGPSGTYYLATVTDAFGTVRVTKTIGILGDQGTSLFNFVISGIATEPITITSSPPGQSFTLGGNSYVAPQTLSLFSGSTYTINFGAGTPQGTGARYALTGWSDGSTANPRTITVGQTAATYSATFGTQYLLTLNPTPPAGGTITATPVSPDGYYAAGTQVQLVASPALGHRFIAFSGAVSGSAASQAVTLNNALTVGASFTAPVSIISTHMQPGGVPVNTPTNVVLTVRIADTDTVIPGSINLISTTATGAPIQVLGQLQPVSIQPDGSYGDYSITIPTNQSSPTTLYYEVSIAARGSVRRVVSPPLPLLIYNPPVLSEVTQTVNAINGAASQFAQLRATLGAAAALNQVAQSLQGNALVKSVQFRSDGDAFLVTFNDGATSVFTSDHPPDSALGAAKSETVPSRPNILSTAKPAPRQQITTALTGGSDVVVLAPLQAHWGSTPTAPLPDPSDTIYNDFKSLPPGRINSLTYLKDPNVTVDVLKGLNQYSVITITSHGGNSPGLGSYILTSEPVTPAGSLKYAFDLDLGFVTTAPNPDDNWNEYYAITDAFIYYYYAQQNLPGSIIYLNACDSAHDSSLINAFLSVGAKKVFGHTGITTKAFGATAGQQIFSVLSNTTLSPDQRTTAQAMAAVVPSQDSATGSSLLPSGLQDPVIAFNSILNVTKPGSGTGTVASLSILPPLASPPPPINCGPVCKIALPPSEIITLMATADPGMQFTGWSGDCALSPNTPNDPLVIIDFTQDRTCGASFTVAAQVSLSPFGFLDLSTTPPPYFVQLVAQDGVTSVTLPQPVTVTLTKQVSSVCGFLPPSTLIVTIPAGLQNGTLDFVAGMDFCNGMQQPTGTKWTIVSATIGPTNLPLPEVTGQSALKIFRTPSAPPAPSPTGCTLGPSTAQNLRVVPQAALRGEATTQPCPAITQTVQLWFLNSNEPSPPGFGSLDNNNNLVPGATAIALTISNVDPNVDGPFTWTIEPGGENKAVFAGASSSITTSTNIVALSAKGASTSRDDAVQVHVELTSGKSVNDLFLVVRTPATLKLIKGAIGNPDPKDNPQPAGAKCVPDPTSTFGYISTVQYQLLDQFMEPVANMPIHEEFGSPRNYVANNWVGSAGGYVTTPAGMLTDNLCAVGTLNPTPLPPQSPLLSGDANKVVTIPQFWLAGSMTQPTPPQQRGPGVLVQSDTIIKFKDHAEVTIP